ncbi:MAG TPA: cohesin domain-containing protein, partial [Candidatus Sulfotelmatobacter sp.]|nr:cohesin domain-containing protein [Candidatus Sulfotelmatobacter sp.]
MPKKTLALIAGLVVVTIVLFIIALRAGQQQQAPSIPQIAVQPTVAVPAHSVLKLGPNPLTIAPGQQGSVDVTIDTSDNNVTAVQLELGYDPNIVSNVKVTPGPLFTNPVVLINKNNPQTGRYTYAFGITPNAQAVKGTGVVATVTFTALPGTLGKSMQIGLLSTSLVTARGIAQS